MAGVLKTGTTCKTTKRYPRVTAGPLRHKSQQGARSLW